MRQRPPPLRSDGQRNASGPTRRRGLALPRLRQSRPLLRSFGAAPTPPPRILFKQPAKKIPSGVRAASVRPALRQSSHAKFPEVSWVRRCLRFGRPEVCARASRGSLTKRACEGCPVARPGLPCFPRTSLSRPGAPGYWTPQSFLGERSLQVWALGWAGLGGSQDPQLLGEAGVGQRLAEVR